MDNAYNQFKRSLLYYPTIRIPSGPWLKQAVLYWDEVGSIVPQGYDGKWLIESSPDLEYLRGEDLFLAFSPRRLEGHPLAHELAEEFTSIIESPQFLRLLPSPESRLLDSQIHEDKLSHEILKYLLDHDLASYKAPTGESDFTWLYFERTTALLFMSLLAKYLARSDERNVLTVPGTDRPEYQHLSFAQKQVGGNEVGIEVTINNWLPIPEPHVPIQDIVVYKRKRQDELLPLQLLMVDFERQLRKVESVQEAKEVAYQFDLNKRKGLNDLNSSLKDSKIETGWGSLNTLMGVSAPPLIGFLAGKIAEATQITDPVSVGVIAFGLSASVALKAYLVARQNVENEKLRNSPYSYIFHAQQEFILPG